MNKKSSNSVKDFRQVISDHAMTKVIDWVLENKVEQGAYASLVWSEEDKTLLKKAILDSKKSSSTEPIDDPRFRKFFQSIIDNGLNTEDYRLFQVYKNKLPLRSFGLAYDINDFVFEQDRLVSDKKIDQGFYMLEVNVTPKIYSSNILLSISELNKSQTECNVFNLFVQSNKTAKRLISLDETTHLSLTIGEESKLESIGCFKYFKLLKLSEKFFISRMYKKLGKVFDINKVGYLSSDQINSLWLQYDRLFNRIASNGFDNYHQAISSYEKLTTPSAKDQMQRVLGWLSK